MPAGRYGDAYRVDVPSTHHSPTYNNTTLTADASSTSFLQPTDDALTPPLHHPKPLRGTPEQGGNQYGGPTVDWRSMLEEAGKKERPISTSSRDSNENGSRWKLSTWKKAIDDLTSGISTRFAGSEYAFRRGR